MEVARAWLYGTMFVSLGLTFAAILFGFAARVFWGWILLGWRVGELVSIL